MGKSTFAAEPSVTEEIKTPDGVSIATMTIISKLNTRIIIDNIFKYLALSNDDIVYMKYSNAHKYLDSKDIKIKKSKKNKNKDKTTKPQNTTFFNQITLKIVIDNNRKINTKLFTNGSVHMTGCKYIADCNVVLNKLVSRLGKDLIVAGNENIISKDMIYYEPLDNNDNKTETENKRGRKKKVIIPETEEDITKVKKKRISKKKEEEAKKIEEEKKKEEEERLKKEEEDRLKKEAEDLLKKEEEQKEEEPLPDIISFVETPDTLKIGELKIALINSSYKVNYKIDREKLHTIIKNMKISSNYKPEIHAGVKIGYPTDDKSKNGKSKKITIFVFESGQIIITAATNENHIKTGYDFISSVLTTNFKKIRKIDISSFLLE